MAEQRTVEITWTESSSSVWKLMLTEKELRNAFGEAAEFILAGDRATASDQLGNVGGSSGWNADPVGRFDWQLDVTEIKVTGGKP